MGYWETSSGERYMANIDQRLIRAMKDAGARFCWFKDNPGIDDETNEIFYEEKEYDGEEKQCSPRRYYGNSRKWRKHYRLYFTLGNKC